MRVGAVNTKSSDKEVGPMNPMMQHVASSTAVNKFDCERLSCFSEERETLFFCGDTVLRIKGITQCVQGKWMKHDNYLEAINAFDRMVNGLPLKEQKILNHKKSQKAMKVLIKDVLRSLILRQYECEAPRYIQDLVLYHHASASRVRLAYDELISGYKWMDCMVKHDASNTLNITNIALLFCHSDVVMFMMSNNYVLSKVECAAIIKDLVTISEMALSVKIAFMWKSGMPQAARTNLRNAVLGLYDEDEDNAYHFDVESASSTFEDAAFDVEAQEVVLGLYGKNCVHHFDVNSASFTFEDAAFDAEAQEAVQSQIELMIQLLEHAPIRKSPQIEPPEPDDKIDIEEPKQIRITKSDIASTHHKVVRAICRENVLYTQLSQDMLDLILFFYAKPMILRLRFDDETKPIVICPVESSRGRQSGWYHVRRKVKEAFPHHRHISFGVFQSVPEHGSAQTVSDENWQKFRWNENEVFTWNIDDDIIRRYFTFFLTSNACSCACSMDA